MTKPDDVLYVHTPKEGLFVAGFPARDLTQQDVDRLGMGRITRAVATGLYSEAKQAPASEPVKPDAGKKETER